MRKVVIRSAGSYRKLELEEGSEPEPGEGEVSVRVKGCGVNFADCCVRMGVYRSAKKYVGWPITPGFEVSGEVVGIGKGVEKFRVGDRVVGLTRFGGYASHLAISEDQVFSLPDEVSFEAGAAFPTVFLTAYYGLFELGHPRKGDAVLVHSAAGGVGSSLVQLARLAGCRIAGVVGSSHKVDSVRGLGADEVIDKSEQSLWEEAERIFPEGFDLIFDANGPATLKESYRHLSPGGKLVVYGFHTMLSKGKGTPNWFKVIWEYIGSPRFDPLQMTTDNHSVLAFNLSYLFDQKELLKECMEQILQWLKEEKIAVPRIKTYPLEKVADAHQDLESGQTVGKLILIPDSY